MSMALESDFRLVSRLRLVRERRTLSARIKSLLQSIACAIDHAQASRRLHALDDRMLADLGLNRSGIDHAVRSGHAFEFDARALQARPIRKI